MLEGPEDRLLLVVRDARALVLNRDHDGIAVRPNADPHRRALGRVLEDVGHQVLDDPLDLRPVQMSDQRFGLHTDVAPRELHVAEDTADEGQDVSPLAAQLQHSPGEAIQVQQVPEKPIELPRIPGEVSHELPLLLR